jgi:aspartate/methionine/tyrosine aminotransferase
LSQLIFILKETTEIFKSLKERAELVTKLFNSIEGIKCRASSGALYAFPRIEIPIRAIEHARVITYINQISKKKI